MYQVQMPIFAFLFRFYISHTSQPQRILSHNQDLIHTLMKKLDAKRDFTIYACFKISRPSIHPSIERFVRFITKQRRELLQHRFHFRPRTSIFAPALMSQRHDVVRKTYQSPIAFRPAPHAAASITDRPCHVLFFRKKFKENNAKRIHVRLERKPSRAKLLRRLTHTDTRARQRQNPTILIRQVLP